MKMVNKSGGIGAELSGGNFWQGAITGGIVAGFNHVMHMLGDKINPPKTKKANVKIPRSGNLWDLNGDGILQKNEADRWWLVGNGQEITVDNALISWKGLRMPTDRPIGSNFTINTHEAFLSLPYETAATYGGTSFIRTGLYTAEVLNQSYHYKFRNTLNPIDIVRDIMTYVGHPRTYNSRGEGSLLYGKDFMIKYKNPTIHFRHEKVRGSSGSGSYYIAR